MTAMTLLLMTEIISDHLKDGREVWQRYAYTYVKLGKLNECSMSSYFVSRLCLLSNN